MARNSIALVVLVALGLGAVGTDRPVPFRTGETLTYNVGKPGSILSRLYER